MENALSLPERVREAYVALDAEVAPAGSVSYEAYRAWCVVSTELLCVTAERDALRKRIEDAMVVTVHHGLGTDINISDGTAEGFFRLNREFESKRVRLVLDDQEETP